MTRSRGFSLLEVMLALVVVAIGISVLLAFSTSSHRETANRATGNDYGIIINQTLKKFLDARDHCINSPSSDCNLLDTGGNSELIGDYLDPQATQQKALINATGITVKITSCRSDQPSATGRCP